VSATVNEFTWLDCELIRRQGKQYRWINALSVSLRSYTAAMPVIPKEETMDAIKSIQGIVEEAAVKFKDDIDKAVTYAEKQVRALPEFGELVDVLIRQAIRHQISDARHAANVAIHKANGSYGGPSKVGIGDAVARVATRCLDYSIGGRSLGSILGKELSTISTSERAKAAGADFNARLCDALKKIVPEDKAVREVMSEKEMKSMFLKLKNAKPALALAEAGH